MSFLKFGIDISKYQEGIDFDRLVREKVEFVILRAAYHLSKDTEFENFYKNAKAKKLPVGAYLYTTADSPADAAAEARFLAENVLNGKQLELPVYLDIENKNFYAKTKSQNVEIVRAFCEEMEKRNYFTGVYSSKNFFDNYVDDSKLKNYTHWVAQWSEQCDYQDKSVLGMWQFGGETNKIRSNKIAGYVCDQNYLYMDFSTVILKKGLNGFAPQGKEYNMGIMKKGDRGIGIYLLKQNIMLLNSAGVINSGVDDNDIFGEGTEKAVIQIQKKAGIAADGIAGEKTARAIKKLFTEII